MKTIIVTGTPGTGKTALSKKLAKRLNFHYVDVNKIISKYKLFEGYDRKRKTKIIDAAKLSKKLIQEMKSFQKAKKHSGIIIDSHLSHFLPKKYVDFCILTKCDIKQLNKRLKNKGFHKEKIKENLEAEIFDICLNEAKERKHNIIAVDTSKHFNINQIAKKLGD